MSRPASGRAALWLRWTWRDLRARWIQVAAIAAIVAIGTGLYAGLSGTTVWRKTSYERSYEAVAAHDVRAALTGGATAPQGALRAVLASLAPGVRVEGSAERLSVPTQVDASDEGRTVLASGRVIGIDVSTGAPEVDRVAALRGRTLDARDAGTANAVVQAQFADHHGLATTGTVRVGAGQPLTWVGHGLAPEQFLAVNDTGAMFVEASYTVVYTSLATAQRLAGGGAVVNELAVRVVGHDRPAAAEAVERALASAGYSAQVTTLDEDRAHFYLYNDAGRDQRFFDIFAVLLLLGAAFAAFNLTGRMVEAQRREIGIGMALGVPPSAIALRPLLAAAQIVLGGVVLGMGVGLAVDSLMHDLLVRLMPLPVWQTDFQAGAFARGALVGALLPLAATLWPVWRAVRVAPVDALRTAQLASTGGPLAPLLRHLRLPGDSVRQMPLRDALRAPRRTLLTALGIATAVGTMFTVYGMVDTFVGTIDRGEAEALGSQPDRMTIELTTVVPEGSAPAQAVTSARSLRATEPGLQLPGALASSDGRTRFDVYVTVIGFTNEVWRPTAVRGSLTSDSPGVVISEKAARDLHVGVGGTVQLVHPRRAGTTFETVTSSVPVIAVHPNPYRFVVYVDRRHASLFAMDGLVNVYAALPAPGATAETVQRELFGTPGVAAAQPVRDVVDSIRDFIGEMLDVLDVASSAVLLLAVLIAANSSTISADERRRQHATMFAFGIPVARVVRMSMLESLLVGLLGTVIGLALGSALLDWIIRSLMPETMPDLGIETIVSTRTVLEATLLGIGATAAAPLLTVRRLRRMRIPETLRVQE